MSAPARNAKRTLFAALIVSGLGAAAQAAEATPPAVAPAPAAPAAPASGAPATPAPPSRTALAAADTILAYMGVKQSLALVVPGMMTELERNVTNTRPEIRESLRQTLREIQPEFDKTAQQTFVTATSVLASLMSEKELVDVAAFYESPAGKKYVTVEPVFLQKLSGLVEPWREQMSTDILTRARQEMKKKGIDF